MMRTIANLAATMALLAAGVALFPAFLSAQSLLSTAPAGWAPLEVYYPPDQAAPRIGQGGEGGRQEGRIGEGTEDEETESGRTEDEGTEEEGISVPADLALETSQQAADALSRENLRQLFEMVDEGEGREAYPNLLERWKAELAREEAGGMDTDGPDVDEARRKLLLYLMRAGEGLASPVDQESAARRFADRYPDDDQFPLAHFTLNHALYLQGKPLEDSFFFDAEALESLPAWMQSKYQAIKARDAVARGAYAEAAGYLLAERNAEDSLRQTTQSDIVGMLERISLPNRLETFLQRHEDEDWLQELRPFLAARILANQGELSQALLAVNRVYASGLASTPEQIKSLHATRAAIASRLLTAPRKIGVLLPLGSSSSSLRRLAREALSGMRMALQYVEPAKAAEAASAARLARILAADIQPMEESRSTGKMVSAPVLNW